VLEADRIINPGFQKDKPHFAGGVEMGTYGAPIAYHMRQAHKDDYDE